MKSNATLYPHVNDALDNLLSKMQSILPQKLVGLYLYGSLVTGDFDDDTSDIDLLAAISSDLDQAEFDALLGMQDTFVSEWTKWQDRLEIAYLSLDALKTFRTKTSNIAIISPGEPFHIKDAGSDWLMNWYIMREKGLALFGPPPAAIIDPISKDEFIQAVKDHLVAWREWIDEPGIPQRGSQAYAILTMCRALYTARIGEQVSKKQAAAWAEQFLPEWASFISTALVWRKTWQEPADHAASIPEMRRFVHYVIDLILG